MKDLGPKTGKTRDKETGGIIVGDCKGNGIVSEVFNSEYRE